MGEIELVGPVMLARDAEGRLSARVDGVSYVLLARGEKSASADIHEEGICLNPRS